MTKEGKMTDSEALESTQKEMDAWPDPRSAPNKEILEWMRRDFLKRGIAHIEAVEMTKDTVSAIEALEKLTDKGERCEKQQVIMTAIELKMKQQDKLALLCNRAVLQIEEMIGAFDGK